MLKEHLGFPPRAFLGSLPIGGGVTSQPEEKHSETPPLPQRNVNPTICMAVPKCVDLPVTSDADDLYSNPSTPLFRARLLS